MVLGWRRDNDPSVRMRNPVLQVNFETCPGNPALSHICGILLVKMFLLPNQVLYDDVLVFHLETAITENTGRAKKTISSYLSIFFCKKYSLLYVYPLKLLTQTAVSRKKITILNMAYFSKYIYIFTRQATTPAAGGTSSACSPPTSPTLRCAPP